MLVRQVSQPDQPSSGGYINNPIADAAIWAFYESNPDRVLLKVAGFIKIRVRDLRVLFELLAGPEPTQ